MRFRATVVRVAVAALPLTTVAACDDASKTPTGKTDGKGDGKSKGEPTKADPPTKVEPPTKLKLPDIFVRTREEIPEVMAGAIAPYEPPEVTPPAAPTPSSTVIAPPPDGAEPASAAAAPAAGPATAARAAAAEVIAAAPAVKIAHNHAPGEPCSTPSRVDVEKALADLKKTP